MKHEIFLPNAKPKGRALDLEKSALLVIDMQRDFLEPGGYGAALGNDVNLLAPVVPAVRRLLAAFRIAGVRVIHTVEGHKPDLSDCPPFKLVHGRPGLKVGDQGPLGRYLVLGEPGNAPVAACRPRRGEKLVEKPGKGAFYRTDLEDHLRSGGITTLVMCGVTTEVCVQTTAREAADRGFEVVLVSDATGSYIPEFKDSVLAMVVSQGGIVGWSASTAEVLFAVLEAGTWKERVEWKELRKGLRKATLGVEPDGWEAAFLDYAPGAVAPRHRHAGTERILMLAGAQADEKGTYEAGSSVENAPGTVHEVVSLRGCQLFIDWDSAVEFL